MIILALATAFAITKCLFSPPLRSEALPPSQTISIIRVNYELNNTNAVKNQTVHQVVNPKQIAQIVSFVKQYRRGWDHVIPLGLEDPTSPVSLEFFQGKKVVGYWGIGSDNFKANDAKSHILYRPVKREEVRHLLSILKLKEAVVNQQ